MPEQAKRPRAASGSWPMCERIEEYYILYYMLIGLTQQIVVFSFVGRGHDPADPVYTLSGWLNGIGSDETVGKGLTHDHRKAAFGTA